MRHPLCPAVPLAIAAALLTGGAAHAQSAEAPGTFAEPSIVNPSWAFDLTVATPRPVSVEINGKTKWYWYLPYKVVNNTGDDRLFIPEVTITNDQGEIFRGNRLTPPAVFPAVADLLDNSLLESPDDVTGTLLQGEDFAKESVVIWPVSTLDVDQFTVFIAGVDGETKPLISPSTGQPVMEPRIDPITGDAMTGPDGKPQMRPVMVSRNRAFTFATPGTTANPQNQPVKLIDSFEVMR